MFLFVLFDMEIVKTNTGFSNTGNSDTLFKLSFPWPNKEMSSWDENKKEDPMLEWANYISVKMGQNSLMTRRISSKKKVLRKPK